MGDRVSFFVRFCKEQTFIKMRGFVYALESLLDQNLVSIKAFKFDSF